MLQPYFRKKDLVEWTHRNGDLVKNFEDLVALTDQNAQDIAALPGKNLKVFDTVAQMKANPPTVAERTFLFQLKGYYSSTDGVGGPAFTWAYGAAPGTYIDNGGSVIVPTGGDGSSAWVRRFIDFVDPRWFGAVGDGIADDSVALTKTFAYGLRVDGGGKTYLITPDTIIDTYATPGVGYGLNKAWFKVGECQNIKFIGSVSFGLSGNFLGKQKRISQVTVTGDCRLSSWYTVFTGLVVTGTTWIGGDYPPTNNTTGNYYNNYVSCDFNDVIFDQRYGPSNDNSYVNCQFNTILITYTGNTGYSVGVNRDWHLNVFVGCEFFTPVGILAPDGFTYPFVIDATARSGGVNRFIGVYMENASRGFYGDGLDIENVHSSTQTIGNGGGAIGYNSRLTGESGQVDRDFPDIFPGGDSLFGGDWSILGTDGAPFCYTPTGASAVITADATEPTGLGKAAVYDFGAGGGNMRIYFARNATNRTLRSIAVICKINSGAPIWETESASGVTVYGAMNFTRLSDGWVLYYGHTYGMCRLISGSAFNVSFSAASGARGAGVTTPSSRQRTDRPLLTLDNSGISLIDDYIDTTTRRIYQNNSTGLATTGSNYDWYSIAFGNFSGRVAHISVTFGVISGGVGSRSFYRESLVRENGAGALVENNIQAINGLNATLSFVLSGSTLTVRTTNTGTAETCRLTIVVEGYGMDKTRITKLI